MMGKAIPPSVTHGPGHQLLPMLLPPPAVHVPRHMHDDLLGDPDFICPQKMEKKEQTYFCNCVVLSGALNFPQTHFPHL